jgi:cytochrome c550
MKNNPIVPYILIMALGIALIFFLSLDGVGKQNENAEEGTTTEDNASADDGAALVQTCIACHGEDLSGNIGPKLIGLEKDRIVDVLVNGIEGTPMTPGMKSQDEAEKIADYISSLK